MTVRGEIAGPRRQTGARSRERGSILDTVCGPIEERARRSKARRSSGSAIGAEALMNHVGKVLPDVYR